MSIYVVIVCYLCSW